MTSTVSGYSLIASAARRVAEDISTARNQQCWYHLKSRSFTGTVRDEYNAQREADRSGGPGT